MLMHCKLRLRCLAPERVGRNHLGRAGGWETAHVQNGQTHAQCRFARTGAGHRCCIKPLQCDRIGAGQSTVLVRTQQLCGVLLMPAVHHAVLLCNPSHCIAMTQDHIISSS